MKKVLHGLGIMLLLLSLQVKAQNYYGIKPQNKQVYKTTATQKSGEKMALIEEVTGTWCHWCTGGTYYGDSIVHAFENQVLFVAVHGGDPMENTEHKDGTGITSYPSANIQRSNMGVSTDGWFQTVAGHITGDAVADITVETTYSTDTRELLVEVTASFLEDLTGDYRLGALVMEDGVTGPSPAYDQGNAYSGGTYGYMGGFGALASPVPATQIAFNHVSRHLLGGYTGQEESLPSTINAGDSHSYSFTYTLPEEYDYEYVSVAGWLIAPNGEIENAAHSSYLNGEHNVAPLFLTDPIVEGFVGTEYHYAVNATDPGNKEITMTDIEIPEWLTLTEGAKYGYIHSRWSLSGTPTAAGSYPVVLEISDGEMTKQQSFNIVVDDALGGSWEFVGAQGFTAADANVMDAVTDEDGTTYAFIKASDICDVYMCTLDGEWENIGNLNAASSSYGQIALDSEGTPYIAYTYDWSSIYVKKFDGSSWEQVGDSPTTGVQIGLTLDADDLPCIACQDGNNGYVGNAYRYNGSAWDVMGDINYSGAGNPGVWNRMETSPDGNIYVLWGDFNDGQKAKLSVFDGTSWSLVGGNAVSDKAVYFYQHIKIDDQGNVYVVYPAGSGEQYLNAYMWDGSEWNHIGENIVEGAVEYCDLALDNNGNPVIALEDISYSGNISCVTYVDGEWSFVGQRGLSGNTSTFVKMGIFNDEPIVIYADGGVAGAATAKRYIRSGVGMENFSHSENNLTTYPVPARGQLTVVAENIITQIEIYNTSGAVVRSTDCNNSTVTINVNDLQFGVYMVVATTEKGRVVTKFIKE